MLKIFIADDDSVIRRGLKNIIERHVEPCVVVGEAADGAEALNEIKKIKPDILITDIRMPIMDGIELIRQLDNLNLNIKTIVISGFDEYSYVREALKNGAMDYLLKPIEEKILYGLLDNIKVQLIKEAEYKQKTKDISKTLEDNMALISEKILLELISDNKSNMPTVLKSKLGNKDWENFILVCMEIDEEYSKENINIENAQNIRLVKPLIEMYLTVKNSNEVIVAIYQDESIFLLFMTEFPDQSEFHKYIFIELEKIQQFVRDNLGYKTTVGVSKIYNNLGDTCTAKFQCGFALERRFYESENKIISYCEEKNCYSDLNDTQTYMMAEAIHNSYELLNTNDLKMNLEKTFNLLDSSDLSPKRYREMIYNTFRRLIALNIEVRNFINWNWKEEEEIVNISKGISFLSDFKRYFFDLMAEIMIGIAQERLERSKKVIESAKQYIQRHYMENIGLRALSEHVHLNSTYFSEFFKNETGKNFIDYLIETRLNEAKQLLRMSELKVYEVALKVGYEDVKSFNRVFKRVLGITPKEYKKILK